ncbi:MAG: SLATT domain-containing protein [Balneolaceae bacterium]|nr:MAG: SLATT domain-containing protein [Balneolaceae bacterium]
MPAIKEKKNVLLFTGHLVDGANRLKKRFAGKSVSQVRSLMKVYLDEEYRLQPPKVAVCSLGAGGDIIFADEVLKKGTPLVIFLPFDKERFKAESVSYPKDLNSDETDVWGEEFERILSLAESVIYSEESGNSENPFERCNNSMADYALDAANGDKDFVSVFALLRPEEQKLKGGTAHFVEELKKKGIPVQMIWPEPGKDMAEEMNKLNLMIPVFGYLDSSASFYQGRWKNRLKIGLIILAIIAVSDAFVTSPEYLFWGYGNFVRQSAILITLAGIFITLHMQLSDKTSFGQWTQNRAKAEQIRSEIWFYLINIHNENNRSGSYGEGEFEKYIKQMRPFTWHGYTINLKRLIRLKQFVLQLSVIEKTDFYKKNRLIDQLQYFTKKHTYFTKRLYVYKAATYLFLSISVTWGLFMLISEFISLPSLFMDISPVGTMISFIALVSTYAESNNSKEMEYKYQQMADGIESLNKKSELIMNIDELEAFVKECEIFLRTQNNEWSLKRLKQDNKGGGILE